MQEPLLNSEERAEKSRKPFIAGALAFAAVGAFAYYQMSSKTEEPLNIVAARQVKEYSHDQPNGYDTYNGECTSEQDILIEDSISAIMPYLNWARENENAELFQKWFGSSTNESDVDVRSRIDECVDMMTLTPAFWTPLCCNQIAGACEHCDGGTIAYVMSWTSGGTEFEETYVRMCPTMLATDNKIAFGLVIFHELMHMVSAAGDIQGAYSKLGAHQLAQRAPEEARLSADNYTMYMAQNALSVEQYATLTQDWWNVSADSATCSDTYGSVYCWDSFAKDCCDYEARPDLAQGCCATCTRMAVTPQCAGDSGASAPVNVYTPPGNDEYRRDDSNTDPNSCFDNWEQCETSWFMDDGCCGTNTFKDGTLFAVGCCGTCAARDAAGLCDSPDVTQNNCASNPDWWPNCADYVNGESCDNRTWNDGTVFWNECCDSCLEVAPTQVSYECPSQDWWSDCATFVGGSTCNNDRQWTDGTKFWDECCDSCKNVSNPDWI